MTPSSIHLTILRKGDTNIVDLADVGALIPRSETQVDSAFLQELASEVARIATPGFSYRDDQNVQGRISRQPSSAALRDLQRIGGLIFSHLLTEPARKRLRTADPCDLYLRLDEQLIHVPWELCYDGKDFLATKFRLGRQVITRYPLPDVSTKRQPNGPLRVLLIADPTESLPEAADEAERLCALLDEVPGVEVTLLGGRGVRKVPLLAELQAHEVVHFAGHSFYDPDSPSQSGWRLHEGVLTASELSKLTHPPLLVFSNSCQAGATAEWQGSYRYEGQAFGIGSAFLLAGVQNYIGTFWVVHDAESVLFASAFYRSLAAGLSLGEALLQARQAVIKQQGGNSLTWASYMLYGNPTSTLLPAAERPSQPIIPSSEQGVRKEPPEASASLAPQEKNRWWARRPRLRLKVAISISVTFGTLLLVTTYALREQAYREPAAVSKLSPPPFPAPAESPAQPGAKQEEESLPKSSALALPPGLYTIIATEPVPVRKHPSEEAEIIATLEPGTRVEVVQFQGNWVEIRSRRDNPPGYIPRNAISPDLMLLHEYEKAFANLLAGQIDVALSAFQLIAINPENSSGLGYDGLAAIYFEKGLLAEAKEAIQKSLAANPTNVMTLLIQGDLSFAMGEQDKAANEYLEATKAETPWGWQKALAYNALGVSYFLEGKQAEAKSCFNTAILSDKGSLAAYSNLGFLFWQEGNLQEAQRSFEKARNLQRDDELSQTFIEMVSTKVSEGLTTSGGEKVLIIPLAIGGGNLRRLGEGEAFVWKLAHHVLPTVQPEIIGKDFLRKEQQGKPLRDPVVLMALAREKGAAYVVWGELQSFATKLIVHGQVAQVETGAVKRVSYVQEGMNGRLEAAAQVLAEQVADAAARKQN